MKFSVEIIRGGKKDYPKVTITDAVGKKTVRLGKFVSGKEHILFRLNRKTYLLQRQGREYILQKRDYLITSY